MNDVRWLILILIGVVSTLGCGLVVFFRRVEKLLSGILLKVNMLNYYGSLADFFKDPQQRTYEPVKPEATDDEEEPQQRTYEPVEPENTGDEEELQIPGVIIVTDEIKKEYPELKNLKMIQEESSGYMTWNDSMQYAKDLDLGGFTDWRLPTMEELRGIYRAKQALGIPEDYHWYWSGSEAGASSAWGVSFSSSGNVSNDNKGSAYYAQCVR